MKNKLFFLTAALILNASCRLSEVNIENSAIDICEEFINDIYNNKSTDRIKKKYLINCKNDYNDDISLTQIKFMGEYLRDNKIKPQDIDYHSVSQSELYNEGFDNSVNGSVVIVKSKSIDIMNVLIKENKIISFFAINKNNRKIFVNICKK